jgi:hypothetical protein
MPNLNPPERGGCLLAARVLSLRGDQPARILYLVVEPDLFKAQKIAERRLGSGETIESVIYVPKNEIPPDVMPGALLVWS